MFCLLRKLFGRGAHKASRLLIRLGMQIDRLEDRTAPAANLFVTTPDFVVGGGPVSVTVGDFNGDGKPDLATANSLSNSVSLLLGIGNGSFQAAVDFGVGRMPVSVTVGDFNGDGKPDL